MSGTERTHRGWRYFAATAIYWLGIVLLGVASIAVFGVIVWGFLSWFEPEQVMAMSIIIGGFAALIILVAICTNGIWQTMFWLEMWVIHSIGRIELLIENPRDAETSEGVTD